MDMVHCGHIHTSVFAPPTATPPPPLGATASCATLYGVSLSRAPQCKNAPFEA